MDFGYVVQIDSRARSRYIFFSKDGGKHDAICAFCDFFQVSNELILADDEGWCDVDDIEGGLVGFDELVRCMKGEDFGSGICLERMIIWTCGGTGGALI